MIVELKPICTRCADCQRLAEALRPNDDTLHESLGLDGGGALPGYWGDSLGAAGDLAVSLSDGAGRSSLKRAPRRAISNSAIARSINVWQFAAAVALGIVIAAALRTLVSGHPSRPRFISSAEPAREMVTRALGSGLIAKSVRLCSICRRSAAAVRRPESPDAEQLLSESYHRPTRHGQLLHRLPSCWKRDQESRKRRKSVWNTVAAPCHEARVAERFRAIADPAVTIDSAPTVRLRKPLVSRGLRCTA